MTRPLLRLLPLALALPAVAGCGNVAPSTPSTAPLTTAPAAASATAPVATELATLEVGWHTAPSSTAAQYYVHLGTVTWTDARGARSQRFRRAADGADFLDQPPPGWSEPEITIDFDQAWRLVLRAADQLGDDQPAWQEEDCGPDHLGTVIQALDLAGWRVTRLSGPQSRVFASNTPGSSSRVILLCERPLK